MKNKKGFTLIEVVVVMAIIAVLATLIIGAIRVARNTATDTVNRNNIKTIQTCLEAFYARYGAYCKSGTNNYCHEAGDGFIINDVADKLTTDGIQCSLANTSSKTYCSGDTRGCSGGFYYLEASRYKVTPYTANDGGVLGAITVP